MCMFLHCSFFFVKQKTSYERRISDWSSDVCSSDLGQGQAEFGADDMHDAFAPVINIEKLYSPVRRLLAHGCNHRGAPWLIARAAARPGRGDMVQGRVS